MDVPEAMRYYISIMLFTWCKEIVDPCREIFPCTEHDFYVSVWLITIFIECFVQYTVWKCMTYRETGTTKAWWKYRLPHGFWCIHYIWTRMNMNCTRREASSAVHRIRVQIFSGCTRSYAVLYFHHAFHLVQGNSRPVKGNADPCREIFPCT